MFTIVFWWWRQYAPLKRRSTIICIHFSCPSFMLHASHIVYFLTSFLWRTQILELIFVPFSPAFCYFLLSRSKHSSRQRVVQQSQSVFFPYVGKPSFRRIQKRRHNIILNILILRSWDWTQGDTNSEQNGSKYYPNLIFYHFCINVILIWYFSYNIFNIAIFSKDLIPVFHFLISAR
jgi:hypothetical protein